MLKSAQAFMIQTAHTALANGRAKLEAAAGALAA